MAKVTRSCGYKNVQRRPLHNRTCATAANLAIELFQASKKTAANTAWTRKFVPLPEGGPKNIKLISYYDIR